MSWDEEEWGTHRERKVTPGQTYFVAKLEDDVVLQKRWGAKKTLGHLERSSEQAADNKGNVELSTNNDEWGSLAQINTFQGALFARNVRACPVETWHLFSRSVFVSIFVFWDGFNFPFTFNCFYIARNFMAEKLMMHGVIKHKTFNVVSFRDAIL